MGGGTVPVPLSLSAPQLALVYRHPHRKGTVMLRTRLASLALAVGLIPLAGCGCPGWFGRNCCCPGPAPCCAPPTNGCGGGPGFDGYEGVVGTPCCNSHPMPPMNGDGPVLLPQ